MAPSFGHFSCVVMLDYPVFFLNSVCYAECSVVFRLDLDLALAYRLVVLEISSIRWQLGKW